MKLTKEQEEARQREGYTCSECSKFISKGYCGRCDEYYNIGHASDCSVGQHNLNQHNH